MTTVGKNVQPMALTGNGHSTRMGQCLETVPGKFLVYDEAEDTVILGKLDFGRLTPESVLAACRAELSAANSLGFIYSGSMEALTLSTEERRSATKVEEWFKRRYPELRFSIWWY
jgi:hypothetical protein